jgi:hypothetical protein
VIPQIPPARTEPPTPAAIRSRRHLSHATRVAIVMPALLAMNSLDHL